MITEQKSAQREQRPIRVVVVEAFPVMRMMAEVLLAGTDGVVAVGAAGTSHEALALVAADQPDVLLLELKLPDLSGVEVARRVLER